MAYHIQLLKYIQLIISTNIANSSIKKNVFKSIQTRAQIKLLFEQ